MGVRSAVNVLDAEVDIIPGETQYFGGKASGTNEEGQGFGSGVPVSRFLIGKSQVGKLSTIQSLDSDSSENLSARIIRHSNNGRC